MFTSLLIRSRRNSLTRRRKRAQPWQTATGRAALQRSPRRRCETARKPLPAAARRDLQAAGADEAVRSRRPRRISSEPSISASSRSSTASAALLRAHRQCSMRARRARLRARYPARSGLSWHPPGLSASATERVAQGSSRSACGGQRRRTHLGSGPVARQSRARSDHWSGAVWNCQCARKRRAEGLSLPRRRRRARWRIRPP